jgi:hypothetical protein
MVWLLPLVGLASCEAGTENSPRYLTGVIEFRNAQQLAQIPGPYLVSMDSIQVDVVSGGGAERSFDGRKLIPTDTIVTANTRVLPGVVNVTARVLNARRDTIYAGSTSGTVTTDGFQLSLTLVALRPVLAVAPASLTLALSPPALRLVRRDSVLVYNRGNPALAWQALLSGCSPNDCMLITQSGTIAADSQRYVVFLHAFGSPASGLLIVRTSRDSLAIPFQVP